MSEQYNPGFWDQACSTPPPVRRLYLVRMLFLVVPALTLVYFFEAIGLDPIGAVPLMYLSLHGWFAVAYARNKSMGLVMVGNLLSALAASVITGFSPIFWFLFTGQEHYGNSWGARTPF